MAYCGGLPHSLLLSLLTAALCNLHITDKRGNQCSCTCVQRVNDARVPTMYICTFDVRPSLPASWTAPFRRRCICNKHTRRSAAAAHINRPFTHSQMQYATSASTLCTTAHVTSPARVSLSLSLSIHLIVRPYFHDNKRESIVLLGQLPRYHI